MNILVECSCTMCRMQNNKSYSTSKQVLPMFFLWESVPLIVFPYALQHTHHASNVRLPTRGGFIKSQSFLHITNLTFHLVVQSRIRLPGSAVLKVSYSYKKNKKKQTQNPIANTFSFLV